MPISPVNRFVGLDIAPQLSQPAKRSQRFFLDLEVSLVIAGTGHPYKYYRSQGHHLGDAESPIIIAGPIMNHAAQPRTDSRSRAINSAMAPMIEPKDLP